MGLILNPAIRLRKSANRMMVYKVDPVTFVPSSPFVIQSIFAVFLTLFDGEKTYDQVVKDFCFLLGKEYSSETLGWITQRLETIRQGLALEKLLVEKDTLRSEEQTLRYNPMDVAISSEEETLHNENLRLDFPLTINFNVTTKCKMACKYCYHPRYPMDEYISLERLATLFDECVENGCEMIFLSGGDPLEHPDLLNIMKLLKEKGLPYYSSTKSFLSQDICQQMKNEAGLQVMQISLDSANPEIAAFLTGMDLGYFQRTIMTIENLHSAGIQVNIRCVLTRYNMEGLEELLHLCRKLNVEMMDLSLYQRSLWRHSDELFVTEEQLSSAIETIQQYKQRYNLPRIDDANMEQIIISSTDNHTASSKHRVFCAAGRFSLTLLPNGEVSICEWFDYTPEVILGDLRHQSIKELWNSEKVISLFTPPDRSRFAEGVPCRTCSDEEYHQCFTVYSRCYKDTFAYFQTLNAPDVRCKLANVKEYRIC